MKRLIKTVTNQKGIALLVVLFAVIIMVFLAVEVSYNTNVELVVGSSQIDKLRASYLAKSGVQLSLLRINVYRFAMQKFGATLGANKNVLDMIWQFPFSWPPMLPDEASSVDKANLKTIVEKSFIEGAFSTGIESEGTKIDLNDLASPSENLRKAIHAQLVQVLQNRIDQDDDWARDHRDLKPIEIVNNIADWVDEDSDGLNGGSEASGYGNSDTPINPPNRPLKTIDELHMIKGMTDEIYNLIAPRCTVYGVKGIKVNLASAEVIRSIDKQITDEIVKEIIKRRNDQELGGPFQSAEDFTAFIQTKGVNLEKFNKSPEIPLLFDAEYNFRIKSTGRFRKAQREIIAIVYDFDKVKGQLSSLLASPGPSASPGAPGAPSPAPSASPAGGGSGGEANLKEPPQIIFWQEF